MEALINSFKIKPEIDTIVKEFRVRYRGSEEDEEHQEDFREFPMEQFRGKLILHHLEPVIVEREAILEEHLRENRRKKEREQQEEKREREEEEKRERQEERGEEEEERERQEERGEEKEIVEKEPKEKITKAKKPKTIAAVQRIVDKDWEIKGKKIDKILEQLPKSADLPILRLPSYYMNNREYFVRFFNKHFEAYKKKYGDIDDEITCENLQNDDKTFSLLNHQRLIRDYLNSYTPYRGLLIYHSLGAGKTATSIGVAEGMKNEKKVYILTPASLEDNYRAELKKAGDPLFRINQCWEWISVDKEKDEKTIRTLSSILNISTEYIIKNKGAWLVNVKKGRKCNDEKIERAMKSKYPDVSEEKLQNKINKHSQSEMASLNKQIDYMIDSKYQFIHYNGLSKQRLREMTNDFTNNIFDDSVIVIDEAHNLISRIVNKLSKKRGKDAGYDPRTGEKTLPVHLSLILYEMLLKAKNSKIVLLTGTPIINYPNEIAILFNILRGYIMSWEYTLDSTRAVSKEKVKQILFQNRGFVDYVDYNSSTKKLVITKNPFGFANNIDEEKSTYKGVKPPKQVTELHPDYRRVDEGEEREIRRLLEENDIQVNKVAKIPYKALPDNLDDFVNLFIQSDNIDTLEVKNIELFQRRILGLTSYFKSEQEKLLPRYDPILDFNPIRIPMSDYQFSIYETARAQERKQEKNNAKKRMKAADGGVYSDDTTSTYRIFSRLFCNYVMPETLERPLPRPQMKIQGEKAAEGEREDVEEAVEEIRESIEKEQDMNEFQEEDDIISNAGDENYKARIQRALKQLKKHAQNYLSLDALKKYSPKFLKMYEMITDPEKEGLHLVYSQFRSMEGIQIFSMILEANGFGHFKLKLQDGAWDIVIDEENRGKEYMYALYTGTESSEEKEMIRLIYNGEWDKIPKTISEKLKRKAANNNEGEIIKVLMITASGSEGINLRNTRWVHIMEPYWNPARIEQVVGRARRICSHKNLPEEKRTVNAFIYLMDFTREQLSRDTTIELKIKDLSKKKRTLLDEDGNVTGFDYVPITSDEALYEISNIKKEVSNQFVTAMKEASIDCHLYQDGSKDKLNCIQFGKDGKPSVNIFSYKPSISDESKDEIAKINKQQLILSDLEEFMLNGERIIAKRVGIVSSDKLYSKGGFGVLYEVYDEDLITRMREQKGKQYYLKKKYVIIRYTDKTVKLRPGDKVKMNDGSVYEVDY